MLVLLILSVLGIQIRATDVTIYPIVTSGTCASHDYGYIADPATCEAAAGQVGWPSNSPYTGPPSSYYPRGCWDRSSSSTGGDLRFNTKTSSTVSCSTSYTCLCTFTAPACTNTGGSAPNSANPCICGNKVCTSDTGLFCDTSNNDRCSQFSTCATTNGAAANGANCACGTADCDGTTGLFCVASKSSCSTLPGPHLTLYHIVTSGTCTDNGYKYIADPTTCGTAAGQVGWRDTSANTYSWDGYPRGCFDRSSSGGDLKFNPDMASTVSCDSTYSKACLCAFTGPACPYADGGTVNTGPCVCGAATCSDATGLFCDTSNNDRCSQLATCSSTDGTATNPANCACGTTNCDAATTGPFCFADDNRCRFATCSNTDGSTANSADCACGTKDCDTTTGLYCFVDDNRCRHGPCANTDGSAANSEACTCGNSVCTEATGLYCDDSNNLCSGPPCDITDGSAANSGTCRCGNVGCTSSTGLICYSDVGSGACRKSDPGQFGYTKVFTGTCADTEAALISDKSTCDAAATQFGLKYTDSGSTNGDWATPACFWAPSIGTYALRLNTFVTSGKLCNHHSRTYNDGTYSEAFCLCMYVPDCEHKNGINANSDKCKCGLIACGYENVGFYCTASENKCHEIQSCVHTYGSVANTNNCECGNTECTNDTGLFCFADVNRCRPAPCANTDGYTINPAACACGTIDCDDTSGLYCYRPENVCANFAHPRRMGTEVGPVCPHDDGTTDNDGSVTYNLGVCKCGNNVCTSNSGGLGTGMFCTAASDTCSRPQACVNTDGSVANLVQCACGTSDCKAGEYCLYGTEDWLTQWGLCRDSSDGQIC